MIGNFTGFSKLNEYKGKKVPDAIYLKKTPCDQKTVKITLIKNLVRPAIYEKDGFFVRLWKIYAPTWIFKWLYERSQRT